MTLAAVTTFAATPSDSRRTATSVVVAGLSPRAGFESR
jgi:hypothetical protein